MFSESRNDRHHRIGDRLRDHDNAPRIGDNATGVGDNAAGIGDISAEIGDDAAEIVDGRLRFDHRVQWLSRNCCATQI